MIHGWHPDECPSWVPVRVLSSLFLRTRWTSRTINPDGKLSDPLNPNPSSSPLLSYGPSPRSDSFPCLRPLSAWWHSGRPHTTPVLRPLRLRPGRNPPGVYGPETGIPVTLSTSQELVFLRPSRSETLRFRNTHDRPGCHSTSVFQEEGPRWTGPSVHLFNSGSLPPLPTPGPTETSLLQTGPRLRNGEARITGRAHCSHPAHKQRRPRQCRRPSQPHRETHP